MTVFLCNIGKRRAAPIRSWSAALPQFAILFEGRARVDGLDQISLT